MRVAVLFIEGREGKMLVDEAVEEVSKCPLLRRLMELESLVLCSKERMEVVDFLRALMKLL